MNTGMVILSGDIQPLLNSAIVPMLKTMAIITPIFFLLVVRDLVWRLVAMWKAGRNNQLGWFICLAIFSTVGILPIIYIFGFQKNKEEKSEIKNNVN